MFALPLLEFALVVGGKAFKCDWRCRFWRERRGPVERPRDVSIPTLARNCLAFAREMRQNQPQ